MLHLEDDPADAQRIRGTLQDEDLACDIVWVQTREDFVSALQRQAFDLVLSDYEAGGLEMLQHGAAAAAGASADRDFRPADDRGRGGGMHEGRRHGLRPQAAGATAGLLGAAGARRTTAEGGAAPGGRESCVP